MADDLGKYAAKATCPVAILRGSHSSELTLEEAKRVAGFWKNATVIDVEGNYALQMENTGGLAEALIRWSAGFAKPKSRSPRLRGAASPWTGRRRAPPARRRSWRRR